ncbi:MAG: pre-peptidase C-terminal domain-containing protein [Rhodoplanes sp.]
MTPDPHPSDIDLAAFAAAKLDETQRDVIVAHVRGCARCRAFVSTIEHVGGIILDSLPPTPLADGSLTEVMARIDRLAAAADSPVFVPRSRPGAPASSALIRNRWFRGRDGGSQYGHFRTALARAALIILSVGIAFLAGEYAFFRYIDDYPASAATTGKVAIGGSTTGTIERAGDADWFKVTLASGKTYRFHLEGSDTGQGTLQYPVLRLLDGEGQELHSDAGSVDGPGPGRTSVVTYTAPSSGTYHVSCEASGKDTGTYKISARELYSADSN